MNLILFEASINTSEAFWEILANFVCRGIQIQNKICVIFVMSILTNLVLRDTNALTNFKRMELHYKDEREGNEESDVGR